MTDELPVSKPSRRIAVLLWLLPLWLVLSSGVGIFLYFKRQAMMEAVEPARMATGVRADLLGDDMGKLLGFVGERHSAGPAGAQGLTRAAAMIESSLGPSNAGYGIEKIPTPTTAAGTWPMIVATSRGSDAKAAPLWVVAAYDARPGSVGAEANASGVASVLAAAHALANAAPKRTVRFAFLPYGYDPESPFMLLAERFSSLAAGANAVLVVEATGAAGNLMITSRDAENPALLRAAGLGEVVGAEAICLEDDFDLSAILFESGLPSVRVATRPVVKAEEADATAPVPELHAAATRSLVALIERLSGT